MPLGTEVGRGRGDVVLDGYPAPLPKRGHSPLFSVHVYCGQTAGWLKTPLGTEVDIGAGHIVLDGFPALRERGTAPPPRLRACLLWPRSPISATAELLYIKDARTNMLVLVSSSTFGYLYWRHNDST